ncbi:hypothetical protein [Haladaptatus sp. ZSTT2]|uniref:hypothetical protein n=1 Tax=Haladaptatus sp. ZSTT2 TaxID=3120515 RepID=UPI00300EBB06
MSWRKIRPVVLGLVRRNDEVLVGRGYDPEADEVFWRPLGGGMEFGERPLYPEELLDVVKAD